MKKAVIGLAPFFALLCVLPAGQAAEKEKAGPATDKKQMRVLAAPDKDPHLAVERAHPIEKDTVTFLGVETAPASATLSAHLDIPKGAGLVVTTVVPDSPAANVLRPHDILVKLDDQLLIEQRQ